MDVAEGVQLAPSSHTRMFGLPVLTDTGDRDEQQLNHNEIINTGMSAACTAPTQPTTNDTDHPMYRKWCDYRAAIAAQYVEAMPFKQWVRFAKQLALTLRGDNSRGNENED